MEKGLIPSGEDCSPAGPPPARSPKKTTKALDSRYGFALENFVKS